MMTLEEMAYVQKLEAENRKLKAVIVKMEARIAELERRLGMDSSNSSKPPSTDGFKKKNRSLRKPSGKKPGGQNGHKGATLELPCSPTETISCTPKQCSNCSSFGHSAKASRLKRDMKLIQSLRCMYASISGWSTCAQNPTTSFEENFQRTSQQPNSMATTSRGLL